jgi:hypothetical protein
MIKGIKNQSFDKLSFRAKEWVVLTRRQDLLKKSPKYLPQNCKLCSIHFEECIFSNQSKSRLRRDANPTLFNIPNPPARVGFKRKLIERDPITHSQGNNAYL